MGSRYLTDLADVCARTGFPVLALDGWQTRARGSGGYNSGLPNHLMAHHTASGPYQDGWPDANYCTFGSGDAPLCNLYLSRVPEIYVCAAGATNTNGSGQDPCAIVADDSMNSAAIGIEAGNDGVGEPWPERMLDCYVALCRVLCDAYGIAAGSIHAHFEWTSRKIDPAGPARYASGSASWDMDRFRGDVAGTAPGPTPPQPPNPTPDDEEDAMLFDGFWQRDNDTAVYALFKDGTKKWVGNEGDLAAAQALYAVRGAPAEATSVRVQTDPAMWTAFGIVVGPQPPDGVARDEWGNVL